MKQVTQEEFKKFIDTYPDYLEHHVFTACDPPLVVYKKKDGTRVASITYESDRQHPTGHPDKKPDWKEYRITEDSHD